jgi:hypothetical protein
MVYEIPGKDFISGPLPINIEVGVNDRSLESLGPVALVFVRSYK